MNFTEKPRGISEGQMDPKSEVVNTPEKESVGMDIYLKGLKSDFDIHLIYHPGCGGNTILEKAFDTDEIVYMDFDEEDNSFGRDGKDGRQFVLADHDAIPFRDGVFDAIYYSDCHANAQQFLQMLRALRVGGIVIRDEFVCVDEINLKETANVHGLAEVDYRLRAEIEGLPVHVFQKVQETPDPKLSHFISLEIRNLIT